MKPITVKWDDATLTELKMFAAQVLGMMSMPNIGESTIRAKIRAAYQGDTLTIMVQDAVAPDDAPQSAPLAPPKPSTGKALRGSTAEHDPKVMITIAEMEGAGGKRAVPVGVNGVIMLVPRGKPVDIPYRYYMALTCAVKTIHEQDELTQDIIETHVPAYPMSVNRMPPQEEIDAYLALEQDGFEGLAELAQKLPTPTAA